MFEGDENGDPRFERGKAQTPADSRKRNTCSEFIDAQLKHEENHQKACNKAVKDPKFDRDDIDTWANEEAESYRLEIAELERAKKKEGDLPRDCTAHRAEGVERAARDAKAAIDALKGKHK